MTSRPFRGDVRALGTSQLQECAAQKFTSRILEGLMAQRGLVEPREGIGCWVSGYRPVLTLSGLV